MSGTTRIPVSLENLGRFNAANAAELSHDETALNILNEWFTELFAHQSLPEAARARGPNSTIGDRFNTLYIYGQRDGADTFTG